MRDALPYMNPKLVAKEPMPCKNDKCQLESEVVVDSFVGIVLDDMLGDEELTLI